MDGKFEVTLDVVVTKDGAKFSAYDATYSNMSYDSMQLLQGTITKALLALGDAGVTPK